MTDGTEHETQRGLPSLWAEHSERLTAVLGAVADRLPPADVAEVGELVDRREFGVAFDTLIGAVTERGVSLTRAEGELLGALAATLDENDLWPTVRASEPAGGDAL